MKQVLQNLRDGKTEVTENPAPPARPGCLLIRTRSSLISAGTERMMVEFGRASLLGKAKAQPEKVKQVLDKIKTDGLMPTLEAVFSKLDEPMPLGYCNAGVVLEAGPGVTEFRQGDRVASNGPHAEIVCVPKNLCAKIPDEVTDEQAAFTVISSIALQGIRLVAPTLGEKVVVVGQGLIGLVATQLLRSSGCEVLGVDLSAERLGMAQGFGARTVNVGGGGDAVTAAAAWTDGRGADAVLITASAKTDEIVRQAAQMCRKRGRIVLVGVVGLNLRRSDFYEKELTFQVSCSYGPGRYDEGYEQGGQDYPFGLVRWTEQRNFQAVLGAVRSGQLRVDGLVTHRFPIAMAADAYQVVAGDSKAVGVILEYPGEAAARRSVEVAPRRRAMPAACGKPAVAVIGAGNFSKMTMLPALVKTGAAIAYVADLDGAAAGYAARKFGAGVATTDYRQALVDPEVKAVLVAVRHDLHGRFVIEALQAGKHVFVEKPLAMDEAELRRVLDAARAAPDRMVMVGFNRRFSPHARKVKQLLAGRSEPLAMTMTVNAGIIPPNHWVHDPAVGGGRIIGEACHFIDLLAFLAGSKVRTVAATRMGSGVAVRDDKMSISLGFEDGSVGTVNYFANGPRSYPKERLAVFSEGRAMEIDNFRRTVGWGVSGFGKFKTFRQDKGHNAEFAAFVDRVAAGGEPLIPLEELANVTRASSAAVTSAAEERTVDVTKEFAAPAGAGGPSA